MSISVNKKQVKLDSFKPEIPVCSTIYESDKIFTSSKKRKIPFFAIWKPQKYGMLQYDFISCDYDLNLDLIPEIDDIFSKMVAESELKDNSLIFTTSKTLGIGPQVELDLCFKYGPTLQEIVFNKENWELCYKI